MNKIYPILFSIFVLVGCNNSAHYTELEQIDSLMNQNIDSALQLIKTINADNLSTKDKAYYSLLLTTAQYKKVEPIANDSIINIAVKHYTNHFDQDKLTRALMYKGGVLADLNYNKLALECYNEAEKIADTTNYLTMALLNTRFGELYQKSYIKNDEHIKRYKNALKYYRKTSHQSFQNSTLHDIGQLYILIDFDSSAYYLNQAINLGIKNSNKLGHLDGCATLARLYNHYNIKIAEAKDLFLYVHNYRDSVKTGSYIISNIVSLYNKLGKVDSAEYYAQQFPAPVDAIDSMRYFMVQEDIALTKKDYKTAYDNYKKSEGIADSIVKQSKSEQYYYIDKEFDNQIILAQKAKLETTNNLKTFVIILSIIGLILGVVFWWFYAKRKKRILIAKYQFIDNLQNSLQYALNTNIKQFDDDKATESKLKDMLEKRISIIKSLLNIKHQYGSKPDVFFNKFNEILSVNQKSQEDCEDIIIIANSLYFDVITHIEKEHPRITFKQKLLLSLVCLKFSPVEMLVGLNLNNLGSIYNLRSQLLKKLNTQSLEDYIEEQIQLIKQ